MRIRFHSLGVNRRDSSDGSEPKLSVTASPPGWIAAAGTLARHHSVCGAVRNGCDRGNRSEGKLIELFFTNAKDTFAAAQPQVVLAIFQDSVNNIIKQAVVSG